MSHPKRRPARHWAALLLVPLLSASCQLLFRDWPEDARWLRDVPRDLAGERGEPIEFDVQPNEEEPPRPLASLTPDERAALGLPPDTGPDSPAPTPRTWPEPPGRPPPEVVGPEQTPPASAEPLGTDGPGEDALPIPEPQLGGADVEPRLDLCLGPDAPGGCPDGIPALVVELIEQVECPEVAVGEEIVICAVAADPHPVSADIHWRTDRPTIGTVEWLTAPLAGREIEARTRGDLGEDQRRVCSDEHVVTIDRLEPDTDYEFRVHVRPCGSGPAEISDLHGFRTTLGEPAAITIVWVDARAPNRVQVLWQTTPDAPSDITWWEQEAGAVGRMAALRLEGEVIGALGDDPIRSAFLPTRASTAYWFQVSADNLGALTVSEVGSFSTPGGVVEFQLEPVTIFDPAYVDDRWGQYGLMPYETPRGPSEVAHVHHWCTSSEGLTSYDFLGREVDNESPYWCQIGPGDELVGGVDPPEYDEDVTVFCRELIEWVGLCVWRERPERGPPEPDSCVGVEVEYRVEGIERLGPLELRAVPTNMGHDVATQAQLAMHLYDEAGRVTLGCLTEGLAYDVFLDAVGLGWHGAPVIGFSVRGADRCCPTFPLTRGQGSRYHPHPVVGVPEMAILEAAQEAGDFQRIELTVTDDRDRVLCRKEVRTDVVGRAIRPGLECDIPVVSGEELGVELSVWGAMSLSAHETWTFAMPTYYSVGARARAGRAIRLETSPEDGYRLDLWLVLRWDSGVL